MMTWIKIRIRVRTEDLAARRTAQLQTRSLLIGASVRRRSGSPRPALRKVPSVIMGGKLHIEPLAPATPTKDRPEAAPATPEAVRVEPQLAGGESWGDGLEAIKANNVVVGLNLIQPAESHACRPARA